MRSVVVSLLSLLLLGVLSCDEPVPENNSCDGPWFEPFLAAETESTSDLSCAETLSDAPPFAASCQATAALAAQTVDHQSGDPVASIDVDVHQSDDLGADPDWSATSDEAGAVAHDIPLCTPIA